MTPYQALNPYNAADRLSRLLGERLDAVGLGRQETPYDYIYSETEMSKALPHKARVKRPDPAHRTRPDQRCLHLGRRAFDQRGAKID